LLFENQKVFIMKTFTIFLSVVLLPFFLMAQSVSPQVVTSSGDFYQGTNASLSWTLGEIATETYSNGSTILTQGFQQPVSVSITGINLDLLVYLEGPYSSTEMSTGLNSGGELPLSQPYNTSPWNYSGSESVASIPNSNIVDWVLVELRDATSAAGANSASVIDKKAGFLLKDGSVVGLDGVSDMQFPSATLTHDLYIVVWHRNHLGVLAANAATRTGNNFSYDFSTALTQVYNGGAGYKEIALNTYGMVGGDSDGDGDVDAADKAAWTSNAGTKGYKGADFNMDTQVGNQDKNDVFVENGSYTSQVPQ
jgi:hypothetical protein